MKKEAYNNLSVFSAYTFLLGLIAFILFSCRGDNFGSGISALILFITFLLGISFAKKGEKK